MCNSEQPWDTNEITFVTQTTAAPGNTRMSSFPDQPYSQGKFENSRITH